MRLVSTLLSIGLVAACAGEPEPADEAGSAMAPAGPTLADFAGHWTVTNMLGDSPDPVMAELRGTAAGTDWVAIVSADRDPVPLEVRVAGDSLIALSETYESVLRPGAMVQVRLAGVMQDGQMVGNSVLTYDAEGGQEVVTGTFTAERAGDAAAME